MFHRFGGFRFPGGSSPVIQSLAYTDYADSTANATIYDFSNLSIGAAPSAGERRWIATICHGHEGGSGFYDFASCRIAGTNGTEILQHNDNGAFTGLFWREVSSGTTADFRLTASEGITSAGVGVYRIITKTGQEPYLAGSDTATGSSSVSLDAGMGSYTNLYAIAGLTTGNTGSTGAKSWSNGFTTDYSAILEETRHASGGSAFEIGSTIGSFPGSDDRVSGLLAIIGAQNS